MKTTLPENHQLLADCLKRQINIDPARITSLSPEGWEELLTLAASMRVRSLFWSRLKQKGLAQALPAEAVERLKMAAHRSTLRNLLFYGELRRLLDALKPEGIPLILLKGIYLAGAVYENMGLREMGDIDVLAKKEDLARIEGIVRGLGYEPIKDVSTATILQAHQHLPAMAKKGHASFEIHWNLSEPVKTYSISPDGLWARAVPVHVAGCDAMALSLEDLLLHLCLHTSYQHQFAEGGLRPSFDLAEIIFRFGPTINWKATQEEAIQRGWQKGVYLALRLAVELAGTDVPEDVLEGLRPEDMSDEILQSALTQVFTDTASRRSVSAPFAELLEKKGAREKILKFLQRVFLPRHLMSLLYSVPADSPMIYLCYLWRPFDLLRRYGRALNTYNQGDAELKALVGRTNRIEAWLAKPTVNQDVSRPMAGNAASCNKSVV